LSSPCTTGKARRATIVDDLLNGKPIGLCDFVEDLMFKVAAKARKIIFIGLKIYLR